jgi:hypothetical protein
LRRSGSQPWRISVRRLDRRRRAALGLRHDGVAVQLEDRRGVLGGVTRRIADAGVNLKLACLARGRRLVVAADDLDRAENAV